MKTRLLWCLIGINVALAIAVILPRISGNMAMAQRVERPSDYLLIPGEISGADRGVVFVLDTSNGMMSAFAYQDSTARLEVMPASDLVRIFEEGASPEMGRRNNR